MGRSGKGGDGRKNGDRKRYDERRDNYPGQAKFTAKHRDLLDDILSKRESEKDDRQMRKKMARMEARIRKDVGAPPMKSSSKEEDSASDEFDDDSDLYETIKFIIQLFTNIPQTHRYVQCAKYNKSLSPILLGWNCLPT